LFLAVALSLSVFIAVPAFRELLPEGPRAWVVSVMVVAWIFSVTKGVAMVVDACRAHRAAKLPFAVKSRPLPFLDEFKNAAAEGAVLELKLRVLANKVSELRAFAHEKNLQDVETPICKHFDHALTEKEKATLARCRGLRNKILHCDFRVARERLVELGGKVEPGNVKKVDVRGLKGARMREKLERAIKNVEGTFEAVAGPKTGPDDDIYGWLLELGRGGDFTEAARVFTETAAIIDHLAEL
jgi:hypothetical protein